MKKLYSFLFTFFLVMQTSFAQVSFIDTSLTWYVNHDISPLGNHHHWEDKIYYTGKDTMIGIKENYVFESINSNSGTITTYYISQDSNKYYLSENLLYDFGAQTGDTVFVNSTEVEYYYIESIDSILIDNIYRKRLNFMSNIRAGNFINVSSSWIEGIGCDLLGILSVYTTDVGFGPSFCGVEKSNRKIYPDTIGTCSEFISSITGTELNGIEISPNPATNFININNVSKTTKLQLLDSYGRIVLGTELNKGANIVSIKNLSRGMYVFSIADGKKVRKIVID